MNIVSSIRPIDHRQSNAPLKCLGAGLEPLVDFAAKAKRLEASLEGLRKIAGEAAGRSVAQLQADMLSFEPSITILGQVKSGKTTLVNALAGWSDLLPSDVNPWTSVVTSLHLVPGLHRKDVCAKFELMTAGDWDRLLKNGGRLGELAQRADAGGELEGIRRQIELMREKSRARLGNRFELMLGQVHEYGYFDRNLLERYICLGDDFLIEGEADAAEKQGWFADFTRAADLFLHCQSVPIQICLRDTPGVNDTFLMREQVTINAVRDSRICVVVLSAHQALTSVDMGLIRLISNLRSRNVIIFVNRIDELSDPDRQTVEIEKSIRESLTAHRGPSGAEIIFGSAHWANRALSEAIDDIGQASSAALVNWAEATIDESELDLTPPDLVWQLSGLPALNHAIASLVVADLGSRHLRKIASAAISIAGGLRAANLVRVQGVAKDTPFSMAGLTQELESLIARHLTALSDDLGEATIAYQLRVDRAHASFLERATHALIRHLEDFGDEMVWDYDPSGLRLLLKSAYSVYVSRAQDLAATGYRAAVQDIAELLFKAFGTAVDGIELAVPEVPDAPAPVALAQTIVLDFNDSWWVSWWRRTRGYKAFSERFHALIAAETKDFVAQFKSVPPTELTAQLQDTLQRFLDQCRDILFEIGSSDKQRLHRVIPGSAVRDHSKAIDGLLAEFRSHIENPKKEPETL